MARMIHQRKYLQIVCPLLPESLISLFWNQNDNLFSIFTHCDMLFSWWGFLDTFPDNLFPDRSLLCTFSDQLCKSSPYFSMLGRSNFHLERWRCPADGVCASPDDAMISSCLCFFNLPCSRSFFSPFCFLFCCSCGLTSPSFQLYISDTYWHAISLALPFYFEVCWKAQLIQDCEIVYFKFLQFTFFWDHCSFFSQLSSSSPKINT